MGGKILRQQRVESHYCRPPSSTESGNEWLIWNHPENWAVGDLWQCDCGKAWTVTCKLLHKRWERSPVDDQDPLHPPVPPPPPNTSVATEWRGIVDESPLPPLPPPVRPTMRSWLGGLLRK